MQGCKFCNLLRNVTKVFVGGKKMNYTEKEVLDLGSNLYNIAAAVVIDINGKKSPNRLGRDIFHFYLSQSGVLYPRGGKDACAFLAGNPEGSACYWAKTGANSFSCPDNIKEAAVFSNTCAARIIENDYVMDY